MGLTVISLCSFNLKFSYLLLLLDLAIKLAHSGIFYDIFEQAPPKIYVLHFTKFVPSLCNIYCYALRTHERPY